MTPQLTVTMRFGLSLSQPAAGTNTGANAAQAVRNAEQARVAGEQARATAEQARIAADKQIENAIRDAESAVDAVDATSPADPPSPATPNAIVFNSDGNPVSVNFDNGVLTLSQNGTTQVIPMRDLVPREAAQIAWAVPATLSIFLIWWPISRAVIRWLNRKNVSNNEAAALEARLRERFETLERNVDTVAVEMERLAEGQRFTNRLLSERQMQVPVEVPAGVPVATNRS
jgi:hypothetical protein